MSRGPCAGREVYVICGDGYSPFRHVARCYNALDANGKPHRSVDGTTEAFYPRGVLISLTACAEKPWARSIGLLQRNHFAVYRQMKYIYNPLGFTAALAQLDSGAGAGRWPVPSRARRILCVFVAPVCVLFSVSNTGE